MGHTYTSQSMIALPRLNASDTVVLATMIKTAAAAEAQRLEADGQSMPTSIARALIRLEKACDAFELALRPYVPDEDPLAARKADLALDRAWGGFSDMLTAWSKMEAPDNPDPEGVEELRATLFSSGLSFLATRYEHQWSESQVRIDALTGRHIELLARLGMTVFLDNVRKTHATYGAALGITTVKSPESVPAVRDTRDATQTALRDYVTKVVAWADPEEPGSEALAEALLRPLEDWESRVGSRRKRRTGSDDAPAEDAPGPSR